RYAQRLELLDEQRLQAGADLHEAVEGRAQEPALDAPLEGAFRQPFTSASHGHSVAPVAWRAGANEPRRLSRWSPGAGVEQVAQPVSQQAPAQNGPDDRETRHERGVRTHCQETLSLAQHVAPARDVGWCAETQEGQRRLGQHGDGEAEARLHDERADGAGEYVPPQDPGVPQAQSPTGLDVVAFLYG